MKNQKKKNEIGITLIALVITIIILLILAGVTIIAISSNNGLISRAKEAKKKTELAQLEENDVINSYSLGLSNMEITSDREENDKTNILDSKKFTTANIETSEIAETTLKCKFTTDAQDSASILGYVIYVEKEANSEKKGYLTKDVIYKIEGLESDTKYKIFAYVLDFDGGLRKTNVIEVTTLAGPLLTLDSVYYVDIVNTASSYDVSFARNCLFDGNKNNGGSYKGILMNSSSNMTITVNAKTKIFAYGHYYGDSGGSAGKNAVFSKYNGSSYVYNKEAATDYSGNRYELVTLDPGKYKITSKNYVAFDEWELEKVN